MENPRIDCTDCTKGVPYWSELDFKDRLQQMPDPETLSPDTGHTKHNSGEPCGFWTNTRFWISTQKSRGFTQA